MNHHSLEHLYSFFGCLFEVASDYVLVVDWGYLSYIHYDSINAVKLNANRMVVGTLRGFDQFMNLVVDNTVEVNGDEKTEIGMVVLRGNSVVTVEALEPVNRG
ncbi:unnamed protein product [Linum tenue]|uniref:Small nuclear ribonucleoprotein G n=1 Tax=Linum tenue TaxID=586396 RepID=A0AAV0Q1W9_9ROSI|nr:unnamed protein product [Linum tenue]CAI0525234.1 unnamed protein product [Linum tenue]